MTRIIFIILIQGLAFGLFAHDGGHGTESQIWKLKKGEEILRADFVKHEEGTVYLRSDNHTIITLDISELSDRDQQYVLNKSNWIGAANQSISTSSYTAFLSFLSWLMQLAVVLFLFYVFGIKKQGQYFKIAYGALAFVLIMVACDNTNSAKGTSEVLNSKVPANGLAFLKSVFGAFDNVNTRHDEQYFYIESNGIPEHEMMTGITNWQQQVPIPHDYSGNNSWAIPIQPRLSANPLSTKENFMKGAIAIAANGIPIFNPLNNRGEDANAIGELDNWGGHCGRADDYHYHLPPTHLQARVGEGKPIAYALDGFPLYGETTQQLDEYLGRFNADSSYQYHTVKEYPYLLAGMRGMVEINPRTKAPENEISPQAKTKEVRPALRPLRGAVITNFKKIQFNQYELTYTIDNQTHIIIYGWDDNGLYSFEFVSPDGTSDLLNFQRK
ncbi:YHYH protein [Neolewinella persica]|uniref:YHYH protein n=1 Tax=Neolewinella persica TaxID=70998 RepID=UPI00036F148E|nr:YHYH protein [Neolewinella persica]